MSPDQEFRDVLATALETGCRPQELTTVETRHVDRTYGRWVFQVRESVGKKFARIVHLTEEAAAIRAAGGGAPNRADLPQQRRTVVVEGAEHAVRSQEPRLVRPE